MIPLKLQPEPKYFDQKIRMPGNAKLSARPQDKLSPLWRKCIAELHQAYSGICAYYCYYVEMSDAHIDHFLPKSQYPHLAYEWSNYRLSSAGANHKKGNKIVIDPFELDNFSTSPVFILNLLNGEVTVNAQLTPTEFQQAKSTLEVLGINQAHLCKKRSSDYTNLIQKRVEPEFIMENSPFVYFEAERQKLL